MQRFLTLAYGAMTYTLALGTFAYLAGFVANLFVPRSVDVGSTTPVGIALAIDIGLLALFGLQHSVMARPAFKQAWTRIVPAPVERTTYVLASCLVTAALMVFWQPIPITIWNVTQPVAAGALWSLHALGWAVLLGSTFVINHFELFGLQQVWNFARKQDHRSPKFTARLIYRVVRHPLYVGWTMLFWFTPVMTVGHLVLAAGMTAYILIAIRYEERDLVAAHGEAYEDYRQNVPMLVPTVKAYRGAPQGQPA